MPNLTDLANVYCVVCGRPAEIQECFILCPEQHRTVAVIKDGDLMNYLKAPATAPPKKTWRDDPPML